MSGSRQVSPGVRQRLAAPRGHRFSRPGSSRQLAAPPEPHRPPQQLTTLIELWEPHPSRPQTTPPESDQARQERLLRQMEGNPHLAYRLQHNAVPHWTEVTRRRQEQAEHKVRQTQRAREASGSSPTTPTSTTRGRHRAPRRWWAWPAVAISSALLFAQSQAEPFGEAIFQAGFPL